MFGLIRSHTCALGISNILEGSNADDEGDYRPGMRAVSELGIHSPLKQVGLTKNEIRLLSKELGLNSWNKPSFACLATRLAYGENITSQKLRCIELAENKLRELGFRQYRVRLQSGSARIELPPEDIEMFLSPDIRSEVRAYFHSLGFRYVSLDLDGYRTGSMNEALGSE